MRRDVWFLISMIGTGSLAGYLLTQGTAISFVGALVWAGLAVYAGLTYRFGTWT